MTFDQYHLAVIASITGEHFRSDMIAKSQRRDEFFDSQGGLITIYLPYLKQDAIDGDSWCEY